VIPEALAQRVRAAGREFPGAIALFDADGTLWREDVGEAFLRHLVSLGWVRLPDGSDPYEAYERAVDGDRATGYAYAAQLQAGLEVQRVEAEARRFAAAWVPPRLVGDTARLRELSESAGLLATVVSASALPIVVAAAPLAGFAAERCRGIEVIARDGRFTMEVVRPITYAEGKVAAAGKGGQIALACGDSLTGDLAMLEAAKIAVVVAPGAGSPLAEVARRRGWPVLDQDSG
jgi:phosphoserine phosphatase